MTFADRFEQLRLARGWSPAETARQLGVSESQVSRWRKGYGGIQLHMVHRLADVFGVDRSELAALAGYDSSASPSITEGVDPQIAALVDADRAYLREDLTGVPPVFWSTVINARRQAGKAAADAAVQAILEVQRIAASGEISHRDGEGISTPPPRPRRERNRNPRPPGDELSKCFAAAVAA